MNNLVIKEHVTEEIVVICETHKVEPGVTIAGNCGCEVTYGTRKTTPLERKIQEVEHLQREIVSAKERLQELGIHNWEKVGEEVAEWTSVD